MHIILSADLGGLRCGWFQVFSKTMMNPQDQVYSHSMTATNMKNTDAHSFKKNNVSQF